MEVPDIHLSFQKKRARDFSLRNPPAPSSIFLPSNIQKLRSSSILQSREKQNVEANEQKQIHVKQVRDHQQRMSQQQQQNFRASGLDNSSNVMSENGRKQSLPFHEYLQLLNERRQRDLSQQKHRDSSQRSSKKKEGMFGILDEEGIVSQKHSQARCFTRLETSLQSKDLWQNLEIFEKQCREQRKKSASNKYYAFYIEKLRKEQQMQQKLEFISKESSPVKRSSLNTHDYINKQVEHGQQYVKSLRNNRATSFPDDQLDQINDERQQSLIEAGLKEARERLPLIPQRPSRIANFSLHLTRKNSLSSQNEYE